MVQLALLRTALVRSQLPNISVLIQPYRYKSLYVAIDQAKARSDRSDGGGRGARPNSYRTPRVDYQGLDDRPRGNFGDKDSRPSRRDFGDRNSRPPRRDFGDRDGRPPRRNFGDKDSRNSQRDFGDKSGPPRRDFGDRPPRRDFGDRPPRRDFGDRPPRRDFGDRPPRRDFGDRPPRRESGDRPPRGDFGDRPPRREFGDRPPRGDFGDRPPRRESGDRPPRREFGDKDTRPLRESNSWGSDARRNSSGARDYKASRGSTTGDFGESKNSRPRREIDPREIDPRGDKFKWKDSNPRDELKVKQQTLYGFDFDSGKKLASSIALHSRLLPVNRIMQGEHHEMRDLVKSGGSVPSERNIRRVVQGSYEADGIEESTPARNNGMSTASMAIKFNQVNISRAANSEKREWDSSTARGTQSTHRLRQTDSEDSRPEYSSSLEALPYTTAASEFLYGYSSVLAAIKANRRKLYTLYIHTRGANHPRVEALLARARSIKLNIRDVDDKYMRAMDKASSGRPHNGFILEASPLPQCPITELGTVSKDDNYFKVVVDRQSKEDAAVNGTKTEYTYKSAGWRHPLFLYVDGVLDEGNLGAIARSAYFLGVDAIATPTRQSAPWSHIALKASAGAAEGIPIFTVASPADFLGNSARGGWRIYASDAIPPAEQRPALTMGLGPSINPEPDVEPFSNIIYTFAKTTRRMPFDHCPVATHPTILMMGAEDTGLKPGLLNQAHYNVGIRHGREVDDVGVDSLNVSVAASLLCYNMLQKPKAEKKSGDWLF